MSDREQPRAARSPEPARLEGLSSDAWAALLPHVRALLRSLEASEAPASIRRLGDAPAGRLAGGRARREVCRYLAGTPAAWAGLVERLALDDGLPEELARLLEQPADGGSPREERRDRAGERLRERLREARAERDAWRRRAEGAEARASALDEDLEVLRTELQEQREETAGLRARLEAAAAEQQRAVERARRRRDAELAELEREVSALRRAEEERRLEQRRSQVREEGARRDQRRAGRPGREDAAPRVVPGRPSRLPEGVMPDTAEEVSLLLHPGRVLIVDGYNVTLQHRGHLDLEAQRSWLVGLLATLAARYGVRPVAVFDGERGAGTRSSGGVRDVEVRFTPPGVTADDEIVLSVEGTDAPVLVVTDDRDLAARVRASRGDVVGTGPFVWATT